MPLMDTVIISPWVATTGSGDPDDANHPQLTDDYPHVMDATPALVDEFSAADIHAAIARAESEGEAFRSQLHGMAAHGATGYGLRVPIAIWDLLKAEQEATKVAIVSRYPYVMGPVLDPAELDFELYRMQLSVTTEGVRLYEDWTGQLAGNLVPAPNQFSVHAVMDESVLIAIKADATYYYQSGVTLPDDPLDPGATPPSPHEKPPGEEMSAADQAEYEAWQVGQGMSPRLCNALLDGSRRLSEDDDTLTYGKVTVETAAWQSTLNPGGGMDVMPSRQTLARFLNKIMRNQVRNPAFKLED